MNPPVRRLAPGASYIFTARFQLSGEKECVYGGELELNCFYSQMLDYSEVKTRLVSPGWCKTVNVSAHTFSPSSEAFPSAVEMPPLVIPPPMLDSHPTYATMTMVSKGSLPVTYAFANDEYEVYPPLGLINSDSAFQLVVVRAVAKANAFQGQLKVSLNGDDRYDQCVNIVTLDGQPKLRCDSEVYLEPTLVGGATEKGFVCQNTSHLKVNFEWYLPSKALQITPMIGQIAPLDSIEFKLCFKPTEERQYLVKPELQYWTHPNQSETRLFRCISEGVGGSIKSAMSFVDFGSVMVNAQAVKKLNILNQSNCTLDIDLSTVQMLNGATSGGENYLTIEGGGGEGDWLRLAPRSSKILYLSIGCPRDGNYSWEIYYGIRTSEVGEKALLCHVVAEVCYPLLRMTHLSCSSTIPKPLLYRWSNVAKIDAMLRTTPSQSELDAGAFEDGKGADFIDVNFGCSTVNSAPFVLRFEIENPGNTESSFSFLFPADMRLELEGWADQSELTKSQYQILQVEDNKLFQVRPRTARLGPDEKCAVKIVYSHHLVGEHSLPVLLSIDGGRQLNLRFSGVTLSQSDRYLHFPTRDHVLKPVELGLLQPPTQEVNFHNGSNKTIHFSIDMENVRAFQETNWNWPVFQILTTKGVIEPHSTGKIFVNFSPLEAREYRIKLNVHIMNGASQEIELIASGFDPRAPPAEEEEFLTDCSRITPSDLLCSLSVDRLKLGHVSLNCPVRRIVFLENPSLTTAAHFEWSGVDQSVGEQLVKVNPRSGTIEPEQRQLVTVEFRADSQSGPALHNIELSCHITSQKDHIDYLAQLDAWNLEKKRQEEEFVFTDNKFPPSQVGEKSCFLFLLKRACRFFSVFKSVILSHALGDTNGCSTGGRLSASFSL